MEKITKAHSNIFPIPKKFRKLLDCENNDLVRWEIDTQSKVVKLSCVKSSDFQDKISDNSNLEDKKLVLYRNLRKQGATSFPITVQKFLNFHEGNFIKWSTNNEKEVIIENVERRRLLDLSGIVKEIKNV